MMPEPLSPAVVDLTVRACAVFTDVLEERHRQYAKWGLQSHMDGTTFLYESHRDTVRAQCQMRFRNGVGTWVDILREEMYEALAETDPVKLRTELVQVAAVAFAWITDIDIKAGR